ncbi:MAG TPA: hypothetical protein VKU38_07820 [Ktedonobacteraceae bacterium]|nr:hypothetical protein [Ktedonobacteraceae bacterium]
MKGAKRAATIIGIVVLVLLIAGFILAGIFGLLLDVLYISLIILAALTLISTCFLIYAILMLVQSIRTVRNELKPLIASVQETVGIVKDTAKTAGQTATTIGSTAQLTKEFAVGPSVRAAAAVIAGQQMLRVFMGKGRTKSRYEQRRKQQMEAMDVGAGAGGQ